MKNKEREQLVAELNKLREHLDTNPFLKVKYPNLEARVDEVYQGILYDVVDDKSRDDGGGDNKKLEQLEAYCQAIEDFIDDIQSITAGSSSSDKFLSYKILSEKKADLKSAITTTSEVAFKDAVEAMHAFIDSISTGLSQAEVMEGLAKAAKDAYVDVKFDAIKKTTSYRAVKQLNIPVLNNFIDNRNKYDSPPTAPFSGAALKSSIESVFGSAYVMTEAEFTADMKKWVDKIKGQLSALLNHKFTKCEIAADMIAKDFSDQIAAAGQQNLFKAIQVAATTAVNSSRTGDLTFMGEFAADLQKNLDAVTKIMATIDRLVDVNEQNFFSNKLDGIKLDKIVLNYVNTNSPYYIVGQDDFDINFRKEMNKWKQQMEVALSTASDTVLELDGAEFDAAKFKAELLNIIDPKLTDIKTAFSGLALQNIALRAHTDLGQFNAAWVTPWKQMINQISVDPILASDDVELKAELYTDLYKYLPMAEDVKAALLGAISGKVNLALEQAIKNRDEFRKGINEVKEEIGEVREEMREGFAQVNERLDEQGRKLDNLQNDVNDLKEDVQDLKDGQDKILETLDGLDTGDEYTVTVDIDVDVNDVLDVIVDVPENIKEEIIKIIDDFLEQGDIEKTLFEVEEDILLGTFWKIIDVSATFDAKATASLKSRRADKGIGVTSTAELNVDAGAGLAIDVLKIPVVGVSAVKARATLRAKLDGKAVAALTADTTTKLEGSMKAGLELGGYAKFEFFALGYNIYEAESPTLDILIIESPVYSIGFQVSNWKYLGAKANGDYKVDAHPALVKMFDEICEALGDPDTYIQILGDAVEYVGEVIYDAGEFLYEGGKTVLNATGEFLEDTWDAIGDLF
jgi:hypothetical protein